MRALQQSGCAAVRGKVCLAPKVALTHGVNETHCTTRLQKSTGCSLWCRLGIASAGRWEQQADWCWLQLEAGCTWRHQHVASPLPGLPLPSSFCFLQCPSRTGALLQLHSIALVSSSVILTMPLLPWLQELALIEYRMLYFPPSVIAAAAVLLGESYCGPARIAAQLRDLSGYTPQLLGELLLGHVWYISPLQGGQLQHLSDYMHQQLGGSSGALSCTVSCLTVFSVQT